MKIPAAEDCVISSIQMKIRRFDWTKEETVESKRKNRKSSKTGFYKIAFPKLCDDEMSRQKSFHSTILRKMKSSQSPRLGLPDWMEAVGSEEVKGRGCVALRIYSAVCQNHVWEKRQEIRAAGRRQRRDVTFKEGGATFGSLEKRKSPNNCSLL